MEEKIEIMDKSRALFAPFIRLGCAKRVFLPLFLFASLLVLCISPVSVSAASQGGILKIAIAGDPEKLDPPNTLNSHAQAIMCHIFEELTPQYYDEKKKECVTNPRSLVEKWVYSSDGKILVFSLRKGVKFHDGTPFNADAVKFNLDRMKSDKPKTFYGSRVTFAIDKVEVVDEHTVKLIMNQSLGPFIHILGDGMASMVSPESVKKYGVEVGRHPSGTGPFKFVKWVPGDYVEVEAFKDYWGGPPRLDGIIFKFAPDSNARMNMLQTGEVDLALNVPIQDHERLRKSGLEVNTWSATSMMRLWLSCAVPPTNDIRVRQAIKLAIDRAGMVRDIYLGNAMVADSCISPFSFGYYPSDPPNYDPEKAKRLLTEAGWVEKKGGAREKDGKKLALNISSPQAGYHLMGGEALLAIQESLRKVGFDCAVSIKDYAAFSAERFGKTLEQRLQEEEAEKRGVAQFIDWNSRTDAWFTLKSRFHSGEWYPDKKNDIFYRNPELDKLISEAEVELDSQKRADLYKKAQMIVANDTPLVTLWAPNKTIAKKKYVKGLQYRPLSATVSHVDAREAWLEK